MLFEQINEDYQLYVSNINARKGIIICDWIVIYNYGTKKRKVVNRIQTKFKLKEDKIIYMEDNFNVQFWIGQTYGLQGFLLGWTTLYQKWVKNNAKNRLKSYSYYYIYKLKNQLKD